LKRRKKQNKNSGNYIPLFYCLKFNQLSTHARTRAGGQAQAPPRRCDLQQTIPGTAAAAAKHQERKTAAAAADILTTAGGNIRNGSAIRFEFWQAVKFPAAIFKA